MELETLSISIEDKVGQIQLNNPSKSNAMTAKFWHELPNAIEQLDRSGETRAIVITSLGKNFSAGLDVGILSNPKSIPLEGDQSRVSENIRRVVLQMQRTFNSLEQVRVPVLTAIQGGCIGAALDMVSAADCRYCTEDAYFVIAETNIGLTADLGTLQRLPKFISPAIVRELAFTGRKVYSEEAKEIGLVNKVFKDQESLVKEVLNIARVIAEKSPLAIHGSKEAIKFAMDHSVSESLNYMALWQAGMFRGADVIESFGAQIDQKKPNFQNLHPVTPLFDIDE